MTSARLFARLDPRQYCGSVYGMDVYTRYQSRSDPYLYAASIARLRQDAGLRHTLRERGFARMHDAFSSAALVRSLGGVLERFA